MLITIVKQPREVLHPAPAFDTLSPIAAVLATTVTARGLVPGAAALIAQASLAAGLATLSLSGGGDGERYLVTIRVRDTQAAELESEIEVAVVEASWSLPDGGVPYLSITDFVKRFTLEEVVRMTDATGAGRIDRELLTGALADAQAIADFHIGARYQVPLATVPPIVATAIGDIARARLYPRGAPEGVADAAKAATRLLERVQSGAAPLAGLPSGTSPTVEASSEAPVMFVAGRRAYPDGLQDY